MKILYTIIILILLSIGTKAQAPNWGWAKESIGPGKANGFSTTTDALGNTYVTGFFDSTITIGSLTLVDTFGLSMFVAKYDVLGNAIWANSAGGIPNFLFSPRSDIATDPMGNVFVIGTHNPPSITFGTFTLPNYGMHIVKYNAAGTVLWAKGVENVLATSAATDASGNVFVTGYFFSPNATFGAFTLTNTDTSVFLADIFVVKYDASGNVIWAKSEGSFGEEEVPFIATDSFGNVYVTGAFGYTNTLNIGNLTLTNTDSAGYDIFIVKYDAAGNVLWAKSAGGEGSSDYTFGIACDASGNIYLTGEYYSPSITFGTTTLYNTDTSSTGVNFESFIVKYDASGNMQWAHGIGGTSWDFGYDIVTDVSGNIYVTGLYADSVTFGATTLSNVNPGAFNIFIAKYNTVGNVLWAKAAGGSGNDYVQGIAIDAVGNIFITGSYFSPSMIFGQDTLTNPGSYKMYIAKLGTANVGVEENNPTKNISIYPNPSSDIFTFSERIKTVEVYTLLGELILTDNNTNQINLQDYPKGMYVALINAEQVNKLVKE
jgi:hypothetical protein